MLRERADPSNAFIFLTYCIICHFQSLTERRVALESELEMARTNAVTAAAEARVSEIA